MMALSRGLRADFLAKVSPIEVCSNATHEALHEAETMMPAQHVRQVAC
jgi:hypothetical protein